MSADSPTPSPPVILPTVRQVIVCHAVDFDEDLGAWVITAPYSVQFLPPGESFPFQEAELAVYTHLVGGLGAIRFGVEVRQRLTPLDGSDIWYRIVGSYISPDPYLFPGEMNRLTVHELAFRIADMPFEDEGTYEFRIIAQADDREVPLQGAVGELTILTTDGGLPDA